MKNLEELKAAYKANKTTRTEQLRAAGLPNSTPHHLDAVIDELSDMIIDLI